MRWRQRQNGAIDAIVLTSPLWIATVLTALVFTSEWLVKHTRLRALGAALLVIVLGAVTGNLGLIPSESSTPLYGAIFEYVAPLSIFWLLLQVRLREVFRAGTPMLIAFGLGALGTTLGVTVGLTLAGGPDAFGDQYAPLGGMFAGTYIGGSVNFNAVALEYGVVSDGGLYAGAVAVDNIITTVWVVACLAAPRLLAGFWPTMREASRPGDRELEAVDPGDIESIGPAALGAQLALGLGALLFSDLLVAALARLGIDAPGMLVLTAIALAIAQVPVIGTLPGSRALGIFSVQLFLAVIGALCSLAALGRLGELGVSLSILATCTVAIHGLIAFGGARLFGLDLVTASVASQANIGGGPTALAVARSLGRPDLALPAILVGSLGTAAGTFVGFWVASVL